MYEVTLGFSLVNVSACSTVSIRWFGQRLCRDQWGVSKLLRMHLHLHLLSSSVINISLAAAFPCSVVFWE
jgi:hypothetical protein